MSNNHQWVSPNNVQPSSSWSNDDQIQRTGQHNFNPNANTFVPRQNANQIPHLTNQHHQMANAQQIHQMMQMQQHQVYHQSQFDTPPYMNPGYASGNVYNQNIPSYGYEYVQDPTMANSYYQHGDGDLGFDQYGFSQQQQYIASNDLQQQYKRSNNNKEIQEILVGLEQLLPGGEEFNSWALAIRDRMKTMSLEGKKLAITTACEMATISAPPSTPFPNQNDHQAQYNMARLITFLSQELPTLLASVILPCLQQAHENQPSLNKQQKANLLMFFAELYTRLESEVAGNRILPLGHALAMQIKDFLEANNVSDEGMKLLLQVFKLAGRDLDSAPALHKEVDSLLTLMMGYVNGSRKLSETIKAHIKDLLETRNKNWGTTYTKPSSSKVYCADGSLLELNDDESRFLDECLQESSSNDATVHDPSDISLDENDVMNEFDTFMKEESLREQQKLVDNLAAGLEGQKISDEDPSEKTPRAEEPSPTDKSAEKPH